MDQCPSNLMEVYFICLASLTLSKILPINMLLSVKVDVVICDIPYGRQYGTIEECRDTLYKAVYMLESNQMFVDQTVSHLRDCSE